MQNKHLSIIFFSIVFSFSSAAVNAQYKNFKLNAKGDTINIINNKGEKEGRWSVHVDELRGEPGYEEEGMMKKGQKNGYWRRYTLQGDLLAVEHYKMGGKDGLQQYFSYLGDLLAEENWRGYDPDSPWDTIAVYGEGNNEILRYKIVKAEPYSVKNGEFRYYEEGSGRVIKTEQWELNNLVLPNMQRTESSVAKTKEKKPEKTAQMLEWEK
ncbi:MAG: hypothetical protein ABIT96_02460, partial [Ferruginibacter sp.]